LGLVRVKTLALERAGRQTVILGIIERWRLTGFAPRIASL
jgi:hypothetical protein